MSKTSRRALWAVVLLAARALEAAAQTFPADNPAIYGAAVGIDSLFNTQIGGPNALRTSYRFRSDHTGALRAFRWFAKTGPGYSAGTGGTVRIELQTDDGSSQHRPSGTTLAAVTIANPAGGFPLTGFSDAPQLEAGRIYHLVFSNVDAQPASNFISVNAVYVQRPGVPAQPGIKDEDFAQLMKFGTGPWTVRAGFTPVLQLQYADGYGTGVGYIESWVASPHVISGIRSVRQTMTVTGFDRLVHRAWVRLSRTLGSEPLTVRLEHADGTLIEQGTIPASSVPTGYPGWVSIAFSAARRLARGRGYNLVLSAPSSGSYSIYPIRQGAANGFASSAFTDGYAEFNSGSGWFGGWDPWGSKNTAGVLQFYFDAKPASSQEPPEAGVPPPGNSGAAIPEYRAPQRFLSPATADGVNDRAVFGPGAREVAVFDVAGRQVFQAAGGGSPIVWDCRDSAGRMVSSGVYLVRIRRADGETSYQSLAVVK